MTAYQEIWSGRQQHSQMKKCSQTVEGNAQFDITVSGI